MHADTGVVGQASQHAQLHAVLEVKHEHVLVMVAKLEPQDA